MDILEINEKEATLLRNAIRNAASDLNALGSANEHRPEFRDAVHENADLLFGIGAKIADAREAHERAHTIKTLRLDDAAPTAEQGRS